jgi:hypothetical protein
MPKRTRNGSPDYEDSFGSIKQEAFDQAYNPEASTSSDPKQQWAPVDFHFITMYSRTGGEMMVTDWIDGIIGGILDLIIHL